MDFRILGPLEVIGRHGPLALGGAKQRALLAILLLYEGEAVGTDRLVDELWGETPPATATKTVQVYVSHLRRVLGDGVLVTRGRGYQLHVDDGAFDLDRFRRGLADGRAQLAAGNPEQAGGALRAALAEWRGAPLADLAYEPFAQHRVVELEELRMAALEERIEADLALSLHEQVIAELRELVRSNPLRERMTGQLMLALYRSGRQAEALECYQQARQRLVDELGLEPGPRLRELEAAILNHDPVLGGRPVDRPALTPRAGIRRARPRRLIGAGAVLAGLVVVGTIAAVVTSDEDAPVRAFSGDGVVMIEPGVEGDRLDLGLPGPPGGVAAGFGRLWASDPRADRLVALDPKGRRVAFASSGGREPTGVAVAGGRVWTADSGDNEVAAIDPERLTPVQTVQVGARPTALVGSENDLWVANSADGTVQRVDPFSGRADRPIATGAAPVDIAVGLGSIWVVDAANGTLVQIDGDSHEVVAVTPVGSAPRAVVVAFGAVWVATPADGTITRIDPARPQAQRRILVGGGPAALAATRTGIWAVTDSGRVVRIDPSRLSVDHPHTLDARASGLLADGSRLWAVTTAGARRGGTLRVEEESSPDSLDPAKAFTDASRLAIGLTSDGLVSYRHAGRAAGALLVPDLATAIPTPTDAGRTYRFQLRRGLAYANGDPVRASDFHRALQRSFAVRSSPAPFFLSRLRGASSCPGPACDLSPGVVTNDRTGVVTFRLTRADPGFVYGLTLPFAFPVPPGTAPQPQTTPPPGTGPYRVARYQPGKALTLVRNTTFREWSHEAQPDGLADRISIAYGASAARAAHDIDNGAADIGLPLTLPTSARLTKLLSGFHGSVESSTISSLTGLFMNVREPPFDDARIRRAINLAIDRRRVASLAGGPSSVVLTCQILPPSIAGYRPYCPYGQGGLAGAAYIGPRFAEARRLIAAAGARGSALTLHHLRNHRSVARYIAQVLRRLGFRTRVREYRSLHRYFSTINDASKHAQIGLDGWFADYPGPADFLDIVFGCRGATVNDPISTTDPAFYCNPRIDRLVSRAERIQQESPARAALEWSALDRAVTDDAPWAPLFNEVALDLLSRRVSGYERNPQLGPLLGMVSLR